MNVRTPVLFTWLAAAMWLALAPLAAAGEIYRCVIDDVIVFADQPCADGDRPIALSGNLSVVPPAADALEQARLNHEYIAQRRAEMLQRRVAELRAAEAARQTAGPVVVQSAPLAVVPAYRPHRPRPPHHRGRDEELRPQVRHPSPTSLAPNPNRRAMERARSGGP